MLFVHPRSIKSIVLYITPPTQAANKRVHLEIRDFSEQFHYLFQQYSFNNVILRIIDRDFRGRFSIETREYTGQ